MHTIDERSAEVPLSPQASGAPAADLFREATDRLRTELDATFSSLRRTVFIERQALGLSLFDGAYRLGIFLGLGATALVLLLAAALLLITSIRQGLNLWTGGAWWSDLILAAVLGVGIVSGAHGVRRYVHRSALARTRRSLDSGAGAAT